MSWCEHLDRACATAHHVLHQVGHVGLRTTSLGSAGLLAHRAHAHASRPQLRITERHQAAQEQSHHGRVFCLSSTGSLREGRSSHPRGTFANTSFSLAAFHPIRRLACPVCMRRPQRAGRPSAAERADSCEAAPRSVGQARPLSPGVSGWYPNTPPFIFIYEAFLKFE